MNDNMEEVSESSQQTVFRPLDAAYDPVAVSKILPVHCDEI